MVEVRPADHHTGLRPVKSRTIKALQKTAIDHAPNSSETSCTAGGNHRSSLLEPFQQEPDFSCECESFLDQDDLLFSPIGRPLSFLC